MVPVEELKARYDAAAARIAKAAGVRDPRRIAPFATIATGSGSAHVEIVHGTYFYVVTERGEELERRAARDEDELLYWLLSDVAFSAASDWAAKRPSILQDFRRRLFRKEVELLGLISAAWAERKRQENTDVLEKHPFTDGGPATV